MRAATSSRCGLPTWISSRRPLAGGRAPALLLGAMGGLVSSTATTLVYARGEGIVAPFEDVICLFVQENSPCLEGLDRDTFLRLVARAPGGEYQLRVEGRAVAGLPLGRAAPGQGQQTKRQHQADRSDSR